MKILYILFEELSQSNGVSKKVLAQCDGFKANGAEVSLYSLKSCEGELLAVVNDAPIHSYGKSFLKYLRLLLEFNHISKYIKDNNIDVVYTRFSRTSPLMIYLFRAIKKLKVKSLLEIPTYPYDTEKSYGGAFRIKLYYSILFKIDAITRNFIKYYIDRIITVQDYDQILGIPTVKISNAINLNKIPLRSSNPHNGIVFVGVAILAEWHAFDRLIEGIGRYYKMGGIEDIHFYIVGKNTSVKEKYIGISKAYNIESRIHLEGPKEGVELDSYFDCSDLAIGSLGFHRIGLTEGKPLKCIEYAARGIPFIYSNINMDFDDKAYTMKMPADDSPIDIENLLVFLKNQTDNPSTIRDSIGVKATWDYQMSLVLNELNSIQ